MKLIFTLLLLFSSLFSVQFQTQQLKTKEYEATLIYKTIPDSSKAILYIHGFNDYFFNEEFASKFLEQGYSFFAIDLHNYGRNLQKNSKPYFFKDIQEFDEEISMAISIIKNNFEIKNLTLYGYSQGALIATLYANRYKNINQLILDSAFFDFYFDPWVEKLALPMVSFIGNYFPNLKIDSTSANVFGQTLHKDFEGEWNFDLNLKSTATNAPIYLGWIHAIYEAQKTIHQKINLDIPVLSLYSSASYKDNAPKELLFKGDIVLDVKDIQTYSNNLNENSQLTTHKIINNAMHGVTLSQPTVRQNAYEEIFRWLNTAN